MPPEGAPVDEDVRRRFEADRIAGGERPVAEFLPEAAAPSFAETLEELLAIDVEFRWKRLDGAPAADGHGLAPHADLLALLAPGAVARLRAEDAAHGARHRAPPAPRAGCRVGRYALRSLAGRGAFADVWRAWDETLGREVAVKLSRVAATADGDADRRFLREARSVAALRHPGIVSVHEAGTDDGRPYLVTDYLPGGTLAGLLLEGLPPPAGAARIALRLAEALDYAHACGVIHRDVKPGNVLLDAAGRPLLADFGLARLRSADTAVTRAGEVLGTPGYMAPEQASSELGDADERTDVYGLGAVLYELLTGSMPFPGRSVESALFAVVHEEPERPSARRAGVPRDLERICLKAMAKPRAARYATARALAEDLRRFLAGEPVEARPPGVAERFAMWVRREPALAAVSAGGLLAVAAAAWIGVARESAERRRSDGNLYRALLSEAGALLRSHDTDWHARARRALAEAAALDVPGRDEEALRDLALRCESSGFPSFHSDADWPVEGGLPLALAASPDGRRVAAATRGGEVWVRSVADGGTVARCDVPGATALTFADGGKRLAVGCADGAIRFLDPATLASAASLDRGGGAVTALVTCGATVIAGRATGEVEGGTVAGEVGREVRFAPHPGGVSALAVSDDGTRLATAGLDRTIRIVDPGSGALLRTIPVSDPARSLAFGAGGDALLWCAWETAGWGIVALGPGATDFRRDGVHQAAARWAGFDRRGRVLSASADGTVRAWSPVGFPFGASDPSCGPVVAAAQLPDGALAVATDAGRVQIWRASDPPGRETFRTRHTARFIPGTDRLATCAGVLAFGADGVLRGRESEFADAGQVWGIAASPGGRLLATAAHDGAVRLRDPSTFAVVRTLRESGPLAWSVAFSPDGRRVAACAGTEVALWNVATGAPDGTLAGHAGAVSAVAFHPSLPLAVTAAADGALRAFDTVALSPGRTLRAGTRALRDVAISAEGALAVASEDGTVLLWDDAPYDDPPDAVVDAGGGAVWAVAFDASGATLAAGTERGVVTLFDRKSRSAGARLGGDFQRVRSLSFDDSGRRLAAGCYVGDSIAWDLPALGRSLGSLGLAIPRALR